MKARPLAVVVIALAVLWPAPATAQGDGDDASDPLIVLNGDVDVEEDQHVEAVVVARGNVVIEGEVDERVVVVRGDVAVHGSVGDDVIVVNGRATVADGGRVEGDVVSSRRPRVEEGGQVDGDIRRERFASELRVLGGLAFLVWLAVSASLLVLGLLFVLAAPRAARATVEAGRERRASSALWGIVVSIGLPIAGAIALATVVGIPLGLLVLGALAFVYGLGWVVAALCVGRIVVKEHRSLFVTLLVGWAILRLAALIPAIGSLVTLAAVVYGVGALTVAGRRTRAMRNEPDEEDEDEEKEEGEGEGEGEGEEEEASEQQE